MLSNLLAVLGGRGGMGGTLVQGARARGSEVAVLELDIIAPPFGINVFVLSGMRSELPLGQISLGVVPFLIADLLSSGPLVSVPALSLWLPRHFGWL